MLNQRPSDELVDEQLFWLVDLIYACKASGSEELARCALLVEEALGGLGNYIEVGDNEALAKARERVDDFAQSIRDLMGSEAD